MAINPYNEEPVAFATFAPIRAIRSKSVYVELAHVIEHECEYKGPRCVAASLHDECQRVDNPHGVKGLQDCRLCASTVQITPWGHHPTEKKSNQN